MANTIYPLAKQSFLSQSPALDYDTDTIKLALMTSSHAYNAAHQYWSDVSANVTGTPQTLGTKTVTNGKASSAAASFTGVTVTGGKLVLYKDTGTPSTSPLIAHFDTGTNIPITIAGGDVTVSPDGTNGWFTL